MCVCVRACVGGGSGAPFFKILILQILEFICLYWGDQSHKPDDNYLSKWVYRSLLKHVKCFETLRTLLKMVDLATCNTLGHKILLPPSSVCDRQRATNKNFELLLSWEVSQWMKLTIPNNCSTMIYGIRLLLQISCIFTYEITLGQSQITKNL